MMGGTAMTLDEFETPVLTVDLTVLERNIKVTQDYMDKHGIKNRPHIKTHKIPQIAQMQVAEGAVGITCQKLGEAEVMAQAGIQDIFLPYNLLGAVKLRRLMQLCWQAKVSVTADNEVVVRGLSEAAKSEGITLPVLVEMDTGGKRCGVQTPEEARALARLIDSSPGLIFGGLMTFPSTPQSAVTFDQTMALLREDGLDAPVRSGGGSACRFRAHEWFPIINEHRPGTYVYNDVNLVRAGVATWDDCAAKVICTVVSRPTPDRAILDGGSKTFTNDDIQNGCGDIVEYPDAKFYGQSEEHGHVDVSACKVKPKVGERVTVIPNHACGCTNLHDYVVAHRSGEVVGVWEVAARGKMR